jgi:hypothetical protein
MGVVSACAFSFMSKYLHQSCGPKPMTRVDINDNNQSSNNHYIRDMVQRGALKLQYISTDEQVADVLTKPLSHIKFEYFRDKLGIVRKDPPRKGE